MINPAVLRAMLAAGATTDILMVAVEADYKEELAAIEVNREYERERKRAYRESVSRGHPGRTGTSGTKERSPTPPKENTPLEITSLSPSPIAEGSFLEFYAVFPRKVGKGAARRAHRNALRRATSDEILAGARRYAVSKPDPKFTKHPATWLNADCWADEPDKPTHAVIAGPWKPFKPEPMSNGHSPETKTANLAKLKTCLKQSLDRPSDTEEP